MYMYKLTILVVDEVLITITFVVGYQVIDEHDFGCMLTYVGGCAWLGL